MRSIDRIFGHLVPALVLVVCAIAGCSRPSNQAVERSDEPQLPFRNLAAETEFVGDDACFNCHETQYRGYKEHGMANSLFELTAETWTEELDGSTVFDSTLGYYYTIFETDGEYFQEEYRLNDAGEKNHSRIREMQYVMGSGISARSYFVWENGWFFQLPITWYTQQRKWDFSPGYQIANKRFDRKVLPRCLTCHDAFPTEVPFTDGKYEHIPLGISCERCHGPGSAHIAERLAFPEADSIDYSIVNPEHLMLERRLDVCQQCHLNPTISLLRQGRTPYDFRPSQDLNDYLALYEVETTGTDQEIGLTSHVGRMKTSACYTASLALGDPLECTTCHDPHSGFREDGPEYFNATCRTCHEIEPLRVDLINSQTLSDHKPLSNCISCHMPKADIVKVAHSNFTDHWIRVVERDEPARSHPIADPPALLPIFQSDDGSGTYEGMAYIVLGTQNQNAEYLERGVSLLQSALSDDSDFGEAHFLLGIAYTQLGEAEKSIPALEKSVTLDADIPERLNALAQSYEATNRDPASIERLYTRALSMQPARSDIRVNYGRFLESRGRAEEATTQYREAILEEPWFATAHYNLGTALFRLGQVQVAEASFTTALELDPLDAETWGNLGILLAGSDRLDEALDAFERAVESSPENPVALGNLGTHFLQRDELAKAIPLLARAVEIDPEYVDGRVNLALSYFRNEEYGKAKVEAEAALLLAPRNELALQILGAL